MTCGTGEENLAQQPRRARRARRAGLRCDAGRAPATPTTGSPGATRSTRTSSSSSSACGTEPPPRAARGRQRPRLRPLGTAGARVPVRAGPLRAVRGLRHGRCRRRARSRAAASSSTASTATTAGRGTTARSPLEERARRHGVYESWILERVVPFIHDDTAGQGDIAVTGVSFGAYHAANFALKRADLFPLAICQSGVYDVSARRLGRARRRRLLQQPDGLRRAPARRPPGLAALAAQHPARRRAAASGRTRPARAWHRGLRRPPARRRACAASSTSGGRSTRTTGRRGGRSWRTTCPGSVREGAVAQQHLIGLLLGTEEDWPTAFESIVARAGPVELERRDARARHRTGRERAVRPPLPAAATRS